jgi:hypothetical protein
LAKYKNSRKVLAVANIPASIIVCPSVMMEKSFTNLATGANVIKLFTEVSYDFS